MTAYVQRLRNMTLSELAGERGFLVGGTREDDELDEELARREGLWRDLVAAVDLVLANPDCLMLSGGGNLHAVMQRVKQ